VLSEEDAKEVDFFKTDGIRWILDPLDGSLNYSRGIPFYCISIALYDGVNPLLGFYI